MQYPFPAGSRILNASNKLKSTHDSKRSIFAFSKSLSISNYSLNALINSFSSLGLKGEVLFYPRDEPPKLEDSVWCCLEGDW